MTTSLTYADVDKRLKTSTASSPTNNLPSQSDVASYITGADTRVTILTGVTASSTTREELVLEGACAFVKDAYNALAQAAGVEMPYPSPWKMFNELVAGYMTPPNTTVTAVVSSLDYSNVEW